jgi:uncharacterized protein
MAAYFRVKKKVSGEWFWVFYASNDEEIAISSEGYNSREACLHSIRIVKEQSPTADVFDYTKDPMELVRNLP